MKKIIFFTVIFLVTIVRAVALEHINSDVRYFSEFESEANQTTVSFEEEENSVIEEISSEIEYVDSLVNEVISEGKSISILNTEALYSLPVGLYDNTENPNYVIAIDSANIYPGYASFDAFLQIKLPFCDKKLRFKGADTQFSFENGLEGPIVMELMDTDSISISKGIKLYIAAGTSATWDCNGFKEVNLIGSLCFSESTFKRVDSKGVETGEKMTVPINMVISSFDDFFLSFTMPSFKISGFDEAFFEFSEVTLDMSEDNNPTSIEFPEDYPATYEGDLENLWQGLYVKQATIALTRLERKDSVPILISATDLIWDEYGLTALISGKNIITIDEGSIGGWAFSLDGFEIEFVAGQFINAGLVGKIVPSGYNSSSPMEYSAFFDVDGNYSFGISIGNNLDFKLLMAKVNLESNSTINIALENGKFLPSADLYGDISLCCSQNTTNKKTLLSTPSIKFQAMHIATVTPVFGVDYIALSGVSSSTVSGFPITFSDFALETKDDLAYVSFTATVNLKQSSDEGFGGSTNLSIVADVEDSWEFKRLELNHIHVEFDKPSAFSILGDIYFFRGDDAYGDGFSGTIIASFSKFGNISAYALFGKVNGFRYFNVDAMFHSNTGIQAGPINLFGLGGGVSYRMEQGTPSASTPDFAVSFSGLSYTPNADKFLQIRAVVELAFVKKELVQCELTMAIDFNSSGGIDYVKFTGDAAVLSISMSVSPDMLGGAVGNMASKLGLSARYDTVPIRINMLMYLDFVNSEFHAESQVYINVLGLIKGIGDNNRAGWSVIHITDDEWYAYVGTPTDPIGLNFFGLAETRSYFMAGYGIPDAIPMNEKVLEYLDMSQSDFMGNRSEDDIVTAKGVAFGSSFDFSTGDMNFLAFYASFELGFGFDLMLIRYDDAYYCQGMDQPMGIDHWYAKGQAYVYFSGEIGINVKLFMKRKKFTILKLQCAAAVRAEGPNPFWALGVIGGKYNILGGLVKGSCKFEVEIGDKCELAISQSVEEQLANLEIIGDLAPENDETDVNVFSLPQVAFNMSVGDQIKISEDESTSRYFKINLNQCVLKKVVDSNETSIAATLEWNSDNTVVALTSDEVLSSNSDYKLIAEVSFLEQINGSWVAFKDDNGNEFYETKEISFTTGDLPAEIPESVVAYSYPLNRMINFYKDEYDKGYITFNRGLSVYFSPEEGWEQKLRFTGADNSVEDLDFTYDTGSKTVNFSMTGNLVNDQLYQMDLMNIPVMENTSVDRNVSTSTTSVLSTDNNTTEVTTTSLEGQIEEAEEKSFFALNFRSSKYNTLYEKIASTSMDVSFLYQITNGSYALGSTLYKDEMFDKFEIYGEGDINPLISMHAVLENADWYQSNIQPVLYNNYPWHTDAVISDRDTASIGVPPVNDIRLWQKFYGNTLSDDEIESGTFVNPTEYSHFVYMVSYYWYLDYHDIRNKVSNIYYGKPKPSQVDYLLKHPICPRASVGNYPVQIKYVLPGINIVSSTFTLNFEDDIYVAPINYEYDEDYF